MNALGGINPSTATAAQPISLRIRFIPYMLGISSIEIPVMSKPLV